MQTTFPAASLRHLSGCRPGTTSAFDQHLFFAFPSKNRGLSGPLDFSLTRDGDEGGDGGGGEAVVVELEKEAEYEGTEVEIPIASSTLEGFGLN